ncbi:MAG TPA: hypothetical protein VK787_03445 [Puia sp.]|jgi:hypothetical protein|nr:hypothetical protein [Puia sp.]
MEQYIKRILVVQAILFTTAGAFASPSSYAKNDTSVNSKLLSPKIILTEKLVSFNATYVRNAVNLHWNINAVNYSNHFDIERSVDGINFEKVGDAKQNSSSNEYSFEDNFKASLARNNDLYYRLKQTDANNKSVYSKVLVVRSYNSKSVEAISVTPDPSINDIEVNVQLKQSSYVVMKVTNKEGNEIMRKSVEGAEGDNKYALSGTSKLQAGDYTLEIIVNSNERMTLHLIKS